jgi:hypothetical protein
MEDSIGRFELRTICPHFGQTVVGIYKTIDEALEGRNLKMKSQDLPLIIYDSVDDEPLPLAFFKKGKQ